MKKLSFLFITLLFSIALLGQEKKTIFSLGHSFNKDFSISIGSGFSDKSVSLIEYHKWFVPEKIWSISYGMGFKSSSNMALIKIGGIFYDRQGEKESKLDWGAEYYLISDTKIPLLCGLSYMKYGGLTIKIGLIF